MATGCGCSTGAGFNQHLRTGSQGAGALQAWQAPGAQHTAANARILHLVPQDAEAAVQQAVASFTPLSDAALLDTATALLAPSTAAPSAAPAPSTRSTTNSAPAATNNPQQATNGGSVTLPGGATVPMHLLGPQVPEPTHTACKLQQCFFIHTAAHVTLSSGCSGCERGAHKQRQAGRCRGRPGQRAHHIAQGFWRAIGPWNCQSAGTQPPGYDQDKLCVNTACRWWVDPTVCASTGAVDDFDVAVETGPQFADGWKRRGQALAALDRNVPALQDLSRALELTPDCEHRADVLHERGMLHQKTKHFTAAQQDLLVRAYGATITYWCFLCHVL